MPSTIGAVIGDRSASSRLSLCRSPKKSERDSASRGNGHQLWSETLHCSFDDRRLDAFLSEFAPGDVTIQSFVRTDRHDEARLGGDSEQCDVANPHDTADPEAHHVLKQQSVCREMKGGATQLGYRAH
jgi:hypothetical protein